MSAPKEYIINGKPYTTTMIAEMLDMTLSGVRDRIRKYRNGDITAEELLSKKQNRHEFKYYQIGDEQHTVHSLAKQCQIGLTTARQRLTRFINGEVTPDKVLQVGTITSHQKSKGNDEWKSLDDTEKSESKIDLAPGKWEMENISFAGFGKYDRRNDILSDERPHYYEGQIRLSL